MTTLILSPNTLIIFTDGAVNSEGAKGLGYFIKNWNVTKFRRLPDHFSVFSYELAAILKSIVDPSFPLDCNLIIFTDSLAAALSLQSLGLN